MGRTQERLVCTATTGNNSNHSSDSAADDLFGATGHLDACLALLGVVSDDSNVVSRRPAERTSVADLLLHVGHNGTFGHGAEREDVADVEGSVLARVDELAGVHAFVGDEGLGDLLVLVWMAERDLGQGSASAAIVDNLLHDTANVAMAFSVVEGSELGWGLVETGASRYSHNQLISILLLPLFNSPRVFLDNSSCAFRASCGFSLPNSVAFLPLRQAGKKRKNIQWMLEVNVLKIDPRPFL